MITRKLISVVIPTYNEEKSIGSLLEVLINQSYPIDEIDFARAIKKCFKAA